MLEVKGGAEVETMYTSCRSTWRIVYKCISTIISELMHDYVYWTNFKVLAPFTAVASKIVSQSLERRELL